MMVGYFTANHPENQAIVQSGSQPSVLQQLANLPFQFFSQAELKAVLFPSLLASCSGNAENGNSQSGDVLAAHRRLCEERGGSEQQAGGPGAQRLGGGGGKEVLHLGRLLLQRGVHNVVLTFQ